MPRGRKPTPLALLETRGSRLDRGRGNEVPSDGEKPEMPKDMIGVAAETWDFLMEHLEAMGLLASSDVRAMKRYCDAYAHYETVTNACNSLDWPTYEVETRNGTVTKPYPEFKMQLDAMATLTRLEDLFALNPIARARTGSMKVKRPDKKKKLNLLNATG